MTPTTKIMEYMTIVVMAVTGTAMITAISKYTFTVVNNQGLNPVTLNSSTDPAFSTKEIGLEHFV